MDGPRFDVWTKALTASATRRRVVRQWGAAVVGAALALRGRTEPAVAADETEQCRARCARMTPPGSRRKSCVRACRQCDADFERICLEPTGAVCCPPGHVCCQDCGTPFDRRCGKPDSRTPECCAGTARGGRGAG